ncbi:type II toxin-antitoxin system HicA family toxin [Hyphobacterium sp.]|uniref:type II toxin-antitoxin system HicA family toxin n=1 Tax=Hyphobacterium sp. TaxID=2004662 RepID=UPI003B51EC8E
MKGKEFIKRAKQWGRANGIGITVEPSRGKGGHQTVRRADGPYTVVKTGEIGKGLLDAMLKQIEIPKKDF